MSVSTLHEQKGVFSKAVKWNQSKPGGTSYNGLYGEAPPERGTFFRLQVYKGVGISQVGRKISIRVLKRALN